MKTLNKKIPIFGGQLTIIIDKDLSIVERRYNLTDTSDCDAITFRNPTKDRKRMYVVAFEQKEITPGIIAHESIHIANMILDDIHHDVNATNDEVQCYLTQWVVDEVVKLLNKSKIKINL